MKPYHFYFGVLLFLLVVVVALGRIYFDLTWTAAWLLAINVSAFAAAGFDKSVALSSVHCSGGLRIPEGVLLACAAMGGTPGLIAAMAVFRHKVSKAGFKLGVVLILTVQVALLSAAWSDHELRLLIVEYVRG